MSHTFEDLVRSLLITLRSIKAKIEEIRVDRRSEENRGQTPIPIEIRSSLPFPEVIREYYEAEQRVRLSLWTRRIKPALEIFGILVAFALAILTGLTLSEIRKQTPTIAASAGAAQGQLTVMESAQRPWIGLDGQVTLSSPAAF